jgi:hypothetical protein
VWPAPQWNFFSIGSRSGKIFSLRNQDGRTQKLVYGRQSQTAGYFSYVAIYLNQLKVLKIQEGMLRDVLFAMIPNS